MDLFNQQSSSRLGMHYFPDTQHYRMYDLEKWAPEIRKMGMHWLTVIAPFERAIPAYFIEGLRESQIQPIPHFYLPTNQRISIKEIQPLFRSYARWGIQEIALFDRPNLRSNWEPDAWTQGDLVENFLDLFVPLADAAVDEGLKVIFPPLEPGGDYWDLSFLQSAMQGLARRCRPEVIQNLAIGAQASFGSHPLDWGTGGPDRWPGARPYYTPPGSEDHLGFRIFEWYSAIAQRVFGSKKQVYLLRAGGNLNTSANPASMDQEETGIIQSFLAAAEQLGFPSHQSQAGEFAPEEVAACTFWLISAESDSRCSSQAWFRPGFEPLPAVRGFYRLAARDQLMDAGDAAMSLQIAEQSPIEVSLPAAQPEIIHKIDEPEDPGQVQPKKKSAFHFFKPKNIPFVKAGKPDEAAEVQAAVSSGRAEEPTSQVPLQVLSHKDQNSIQTEKVTPISHYVLLPLYAWGAADWDLTAIEPMIQQSHPTIGFSLDEARFAQRVTIVGGEGALSNDAISMLEANGCLVERVLDDGTLVAS